MSISADRSAISAILSSGAVGVEARGNMPDARLLPEETAVLGRVADVRRREFSTARSLARIALAELGFPAIPILPGANREPMWPPGVVGSITHCPGYCAVAVAPNTSLASIGIDAEVHAELPPGILQMVASEEEREWISGRSGDAVCWDRVLFSAKESVYKAWFPIARRWLGFEHVTVAFGPDTFSFRARLLVEPLIIDNDRVTDFDGRFRLYGGHILTSVAITARGIASPDSGRT